MHRYFPALLVASVVFLGCTSASSDQRVLTDPEIVQIILTLHQGEMQHGELATVRSSSHSVRDYARVVGGDHRAAGSHIRTLASTTVELTPVESELSIQLASRSNRSLETLGTWRGTEFDRRFMDVQIELHEWMLDTIEKNLIPSARNRELRALLESQRGAVANHIARAREIRSGL